MSGARLEPIAGGDLNDAYRAVAPDGGVAFLKTRADAAPDEYEYEAAGLRWLAQAGAIRVPRVLACDGSSLTLEWIEPQGAIDHAALGAGLAALHRAGAPAHGWAPGGETRIGPLRFRSLQYDRWPPFYAEHRILPLVARTRDSGSLRPGEAAAIETVCNRIEELAGPDEPPARLHGDLWTGNVIASAHGPVLVDPAAYGGHREIDLAMLTLFGSPPPALLSAYEEIAPLAQGHEQRAGLWQLFPLLVHAALFGGAYGSRAAAVARRYK